MSRLHYESFVMLYHHEDPEPENTGFVNHTNAHDAIHACLVADPDDRRLDYYGKPNCVRVHFRNGGSGFEDFEPKMVWENWECFKEQLDTYVLSTKIQLNLDLERDVAVERMVIKALDNQRLRARK